MTFAQRLRYARFILRLSQSDLARALGASPNSVVNWENEHSIPSPQFIEAFKTFCRTHGIIPKGKGDAENNGENLTKSAKDALTFGEKLVYIRYLTGFSQGELARAIGVSRTTIENWENGYHLPGPQHTDAVADFCRTRGITLGDQDIAAINIRFAKAAEAPKLRAFSPAAGALNAMTDRLQKAGV